MPSRGRALPRSGARSRVRCTGSFTVDAELGAIERSGYSSGFMGMMVDFRGVQPVREINGARLPDQQVRWVRPPPGDNRRGETYAGRQNMKRLLKLAIAAQQEGTEERMRLEQLLRKLDQGG